MASEPVVPALRRFLIAEGIVRAPNAPGDEPVVLASNDIPAPADAGARAVVGLYPSGGIPARRYESWQLRRIIDVRLRTLTASAADELEQQIASAIVDRRGWSMSGLQVIECLEWRALQPLGADSSGHEFLAAYVFQLYRT